MPANRFTPRIANIKVITPISMLTFAIEPIDAISASIRVFIEELCDTNLSGRKIRSSLKIFRKGKFILARLNKRELGERILLPSVKKTRAYNKAIKFIPAFC